MRQIDRISDNEISINYPLRDAFNEVNSAIERIGKVSRRDSNCRFIEGRIKHGLQSVKVRTSLVERSPGKTTVVVQASSDDIWGAGARSATKRLIETLANLDNEGYEPDRSGIHPAALAGLVMIFVLLVILMLKYLRFF